MLVSRAAAASYSQLKRRRRRGARAARRTQRPASPPCCRRAPRRAGAGGAALEAAGALPLAGPALAAVRARAGEALAAARLPRDALLAGRGLRPARPVLNHVRVDDAREVALRADLRLRALVRAGREPALPLVAASLAVVARGDEDRAVHVRHARTLR